MPAPAMGPGTGATGVYSYRTCATMLSPVNVPSLTLKASTPNDIVPVPSKKLGLGKPKKPEGLAAPGIRNVVPEGLLFRFNEKLKPLVLLSGVHVAPNPNERIMSTSVKVPMDVSNRLKLSGTNVNGT